MNLGLQDKTVIVTGASKGIGCAAVEAFLKEDAKIAVCSRHGDELKEAAQALSGLREMYYEAFDVSSATGNYAFAEHVRDHFGSLDVWVNNASVTGYKEGEEYDDEEIDFMTRICFKSVICGCQTTFRYMREQKKGAVVSVSSLVARYSSAGRSTLYGPLKSAVSSLTNTFAGEYYTHSMRVTYIMPGFTVMPLVKKVISQEELDRNASSTLLRRMTKPEEIVEPTVFLTNDAASYMTAITIEVSGGRGTTLNPTYVYGGLETK